MRKVEVPEGLKESLKDASPHPNPSALRLADLRVGLKVRVTRRRGVPRSGEVRTSPFYGMHWCIDLGTGRILPLDEVGLIPISGEWFGCVEYQNPVRRFFHRFRPRSEANEFDLLP